MRKGQMFSLDFIVAMGLVVLMFGTILLVAEKRNLDSNETFARERLIEKTNNAINLLFATNEYACDTNGNKLIASLDLNKLNQKKTTLKKTLGLSDYNVVLSIESTEFISNSITNEKQQIVFDLNVLTCYDSNILPYTFPLDCTQGTCYTPDNTLKEKTIQIRVAQ